MHHDEEDPPRSPQISIGYPAGQLARALARANESGDPQALERVRRWTDALNNILSGHVVPGQRQAVGSLPTWVTLEVVTGGFATGHALSAGPLRAHERHLLAELGLESDPLPRLALNRYFLSDEGLRRLGDALTSGRYEVEVPEEGALLVVAWLADQGHADQGRELLDAIAPHMAQLRFYPVLTDVPRSFGTQVCLETVGVVANRLERIPPNRRVLAQREAVGVWTPLYDRLVALFLETVVGKPPVAKKDDSGRWQRGPKGQFVVEGGWPCAQYPAGWRDRGTVLMAELRTARKQHQSCGKASRSNETLAMLIDSLDAVLKDPASLTGREVGRIRLTLARYVACRGLPGSELARAVRDRQLPHATAPTYQEIARHVGQRLAKLAQNDGLDDLTELIAPIQPGEALGERLAQGALVPAAIARKLERCLRDSVEGLVERGLIPSGEVLAQVLPQLTSGLRAAGIEDPSLRGLYGSVYRAFRRRRSLLLLDLQKQVQIEELPWVQTIERYRRQDLPAAELALQALVETSALALKAFPQAILPNKLIQELVALARGANLSIPLTEEVAADIFMGQFSRKFSEAVGLAAKVLGDSIYSRYYAIDYDRVLADLAEAIAAPEPSARRTGARGPDALARLCATRAGVSLGTYRPAVNGQVIEQQLILTTHNLAALASLPGVRESLTGRWDSLAKHCFAWLVQHLQLPEAGYHVGLVRIKNAAYAWRQMVFFLSQDEPSAGGFLRWAREHVMEQSGDFVLRFEPALRGLEFAIEGSGGRGAVHQVFLGWTSQRHWLMLPKTA
ncbi:hypothetical protein [Ideonella sp.]|uniref:hypothetical protein n=1 Tax=Ideonella sp. TaxID=1929293 RepID=UPI0035B473A8